MTTVWNETKLTPIILLLAYTCTYTFKLCLCCTCKNYFKINVNLKKKLNKNTINLTVDIAMNVWLEVASDTKFDLDYLDTIGEV